MKSVYLVRRAWEFILNYVGKTWSNGLFYRKTAIAAGILYALIVWRRRVIRFRDGDRLETSRLTGLNDSGTGLLTQTDDATSSGEKAFQEAVQYVPRLKNISTEQKLRFYALYKQATVGACNVEKPSSFDLVGLSKWKSWHSIGITMSKSEAMNAYVEEVKRIEPSWLVRSHEEACSKAEDCNEPQSGFSFGVRVSKLREPDTSLVPCDDPTGNLFALAADGETDKLMNQLLEDGRDINDIRGSDGETLLHMACDRGHKDMIRNLLIEKNAKLNAVDVEGVTPLEYALENSQESVVRMLVEEFGADTRTPTSKVT